MTYVLYFSDATSSGLSFFKKKILSSNFQEAPFQVMQFTGFVLLLYCGFILLCKYIVWVSEMLGQHVFSRPLHSFPYKFAPFEHHLLFWSRKFKCHMLDEPILINLFSGRHKTRLHIGQLVKETSAKLKQASETDHRAEVSVSVCYIFLLNCLIHPSHLGMYVWIYYRFKTPQLSIEVELKGFIRLYLAPST